MRKPWALAVLLLLPAASARADYADRKAKVQQQLQEACANDIGLNCAGQTTFATGLLSCLDQNLDVLDDDCKKADRKAHAFFERHRRKRRKSGGS